MKSTCRGDGPAHDVGMTRAHIEAPATHFRLEDETWALAIEDYKNGATAKDVAAKWMVAPSSVYRQAALAGAGKRKVGDARSRAHARLVEEEEASSRAMHPVGSRALKGLFAPERTDRAEEADPGHLARVAILASGRAMSGRLWSEAKALAGLAESYARLATRERQMEPPEDPQERGRQAALDFLRRAAVRDRPAEEG